MADADFNVKAIISAQTSQFEKGIKNAQSSINTMSKSIEGVQKLLKSAFSIVGIGVSIKAVTDFGRSCVQSATQAQKAFNILDNTVKATGADAWTSIENLESASKALSKSTNYSVTEIQKMQSVLLGFTNITGEAFDGASEAVLDMATVMGMDLTSAVQTIGKALDDPITGLDSLRRQGFKFTDEQKAELTQLVKNGKQLEAQKIILDTLATSYGGAAKAGQDSFAKQRHAVENFRDTLGGKLIPVMQVFAENSAKTLNNLTNLISNMDFTPIVNVVTNLSKIFASAFQNISNYLKNVKDEVTDFISRFNFKPIVSVLDTLIGVLVGVISKFKEMNSQKLEVFDKLKETFIDFSNSETFQNIVNFINKIIDAVFFLWSEIQDITMEIRQMIVDRIIEIWNKIKEFFQNSQNALSQSGQDIASWGDLFYDILNNSFRIFQDFFGMIKALIHGDWSVAWEYAKLTVMRVADSILDLISTIANAFPNLINGMIDGLNVLISELNKVRGWFGKDPLGLISAFESVDLSKKSGLEDKIKESENKIKELTGQAADVAIKDLQGVSTQFAGFTSSALGFIQDLTDGVATETEKQKKYFSSVPKDSEDSYKAFSEWDGKLLQQRLDKLKEHGKEYTKEFHDINLALIEEERKKAHEADKTGAETEKIDEYYNNEILKEEKRFSDEKKKHWQETLNKIIGFMKTFAQTAINVFKKVASGIKTAISGIGNIFSKLFSFNVDDALDNLLKFEDSVLTFFVETLPKLPAFFESAIQSIIILIQTVLSVLDFNQISNIIESIIKTIGTLVTTIAKYINDNSEKLTNGLIQLVKTVINGFSNWIKSGGWKELLNAILTIQKMIEDVVSENLPAIVDTIIEMLPDLIDTLIASIVSASKTLAKIIKPIIKLVLALIDAIIEVITSDEVMDASLDAIMALVDAVIDDLLPGIFKLIPKLIVKIIAQVIKNFPKIVKSLVDGFIKAFTKVNWFEVVKQIFMGFIDAFKDLFGIHSPSTLFEGFGFNIVEGLVNGLKGIADAVSAVLEPLFELISKLFSESFDFGEFLIGESFNALLNTLNSINDVVVKLTEVSFKGLKEIIDSSGNSFAKITDSVGNLLEKLTALIDKINQATSALGLGGGSSGGSSGIPGLPSVPGISGGGGGYSIPNPIEIVSGTIEGVKEAVEDAVHYVSDAIEDASSGGGYGSHSTGSTAGDIAVDLFVPGGFLRHFLATGTNNALSGLALVGEAGPELVKFRGGEQVLNAHNTQKALNDMGRGNNNFNVTFNNTKDTTAFKMMQELKQYNRQMAINGIL